MAGKKRSNSEPAFTARFARQVSTSTSQQAQWPSIDWESTIDVALWRRQAAVAGVGWKGRRCEASSRAFSRRGRSTGLARTAIAPESSGWLVGDQAETRM